MDPKPQGPRGRRKGRPQGGERSPPTGESLTQGPPGREAGGQRHPGGPTPTGEGRNTRPTPAREGAPQATPTQRGRDPDGGATGDPDPAGKKREKPITK